MTAKPSVVARHRIGAVTTKAVPLIKVTLFAFTSRVRFQLAPTLAGNSHSLVRVSRQVGESVEWDVKVPTGKNRLMRSAFKQLRVQITGVKRPAKSQKLIAKGLRHHYSVAEIRNDQGIRVRVTLTPFPLQQFHVLFTLSSECFSTFPHGTCLLSDLLDI